MKSCPSCSYPNPDNLSTCYKCGVEIDPKPAPIDQSSARTDDPQAPPPLDPNVCAECGAPPEQGGYTLPLCPNCRTKMASLPLPGWAVTSVFAVAIVLILAFSRFSSALEAGVAFERGQRAEAAGQCQAARDQYQQVVAHYPNSTLALVRLAVTQCESMDVAGADATLQKLEGRSASEETIAELNGAVARMEMKRSIQRQRQKEWQR